MDAASVSVSYIGSSGDSLSVDWDNATSAAYLGINSTSPIDDVTCAGHVGIGGREAVPSITGSVDVGDLDTCSVLGSVSGTITTTGYLYLNTNDADADVNSLSAGGSVTASIGGTLTGGVTAAGNSFLRVDGDLNVPITLGSGVGSTGSTVQIGGDDNAAITCDDSVLYLGVKGDLTDEGSVDAGGELSAAICGNMVGDLSAGGLVSLSVGGDYITSAGLIFSAPGDGGTISGDVTTTSGSMTISAAQGISGNITDDSGDIAGVVAGGDISGTIIDDSGDITNVEAGGNITGDIIDEDGNIGTSGNPITGQDISGDIEAEDGDIGWVTAIGTLGGDVTASGTLDTLHAGTIAGDISAGEGITSITASEDITGSIACSDGTIQTVSAGRDISGGSVDGQEVDYQYGSDSDAPGYQDVTFITTKQRNADAVISYVANYYGDSAHPDSVTESVSFGTNRGVAMDAPPSTAPIYLTGGYNGDDPYLITVNTYTGDGQIATTTDPREIATKYYYDSLDRLVYTVSAWDGSYDPTTGAAPPAANLDQTTQYAYDSTTGVEDSVTQLAPAGSVNQATKYEYDLASGGGQTGNLLSSAYYPSAMIVPASATNGITGATKEVFGYNALGQVIAEKDLNGIVHHYVYNVLGELTSETVDTSTIPAGVDSTVTELDYQYDVFGHIVLATSKNSSGTGVNQVQDTYNNFGQLMAETESASGTVTLSSPTVTYSYTSPSGGSLLSTITYPDAGPTGSGPRVISYNYSNTLDSDVGRPTSISDGSGTLQSYQYLGLDTPVDTTDYLDSNNTLSLNYTSGLASDSGTQYAGLDQFGRVTGQNWALTTTSDDGSTTNNVDQFQYGYDADSNELFQRVMAVIGTPIGVSYSQLYGDYDKLNRPTSWEQVALNTAGAAISGPVGKPVAYNYDAQGNIVGVPAPSSNSSQNNELQLPDTPNSDTIEFDAFGRAVVVKTAIKDLPNPAQSETITTTYSYDALGRLITQVSIQCVTTSYFDTDGYSMGSATTTTTTANNILVHDATGDVIEERDASTGAPLAQYVWNAASPGTLVLVDQALFAGGSLGQRYWVTTDAQGNVTALVGLMGSTWQAVQRFTYTPQGQITVLNGDFSTPAKGTTPYIAYGYHTERYDSASDLNITPRGFYDPVAGNIIQPNYEAIFEGRNITSGGSFAFGLIPDSLATPLTIGSAVALAAVATWLTGGYAAPWLLEAAGVGVTTTAAGATVTTLGGTIAAEAAGNAVGFAIVGGATSYASGRTGWQVAEDTAWSAGIGLVTGGVFGAFRFALAGGIVVPAGLTPSNTIFNGVRSAEGTADAVQGAKLAEYYRQAEEYGTGGIEQLENGRYRFYGELDPADTPGTMTVRIKVREWDPATGNTRTWFETVDQQGTVRIVRPETGGPKVHYLFDAEGNYVGTR